MAGLTYDPQRDQMTNAYKSIDLTDLRINWTRSILNNGIDLTDRSEVSAYLSQVARYRWSEDGLQLWAKHSNLTQIYSWFSLPGALPNVNHPVNVSRASITDVDWSVVDVAFLKESFDYVLVGTHLYETFDTLLPIFESMIRNGLGGTLNAFKVRVLQ